MCARLYPHTSPLFVQSEAKEGKRREMLRTFSSSMIKFQCRMLWSLRILNLNLVFKVVMKVYLQRNYDTLFNSLQD